MESLQKELCCQGAMNMLDSRFVLKGTRPFYSPDRTFDTEHIRLELAVDLERERVRGRCQTTLRAITNNARAMTFDAVNFQIRAVRWEGKKTRFSYKNGKLMISSRLSFKEGTRTTVEIDYVIKKPKLGLYFVKPDRYYPQNPTQVWTQGEDEYARYWFPCHDAPHERTTTEILATVPSGFLAISNGRLVKTTHNKRENTSTFHWKQERPHATYLVTLAVGKFKVLRDKWRNIPILYYCEKGREKDTWRTFSKTPKMLEFFSRSIGINYPYPKYAQVIAANFIYGGMENTSATTQTDYALLDKRASLDYSSDDLVAHELAHQWFGDYLTCRDWSHAWLNESFATYFDALFKRHDLGEDEFLYAIYGNTQEYFEEDKSHYRRPVVTSLFKRPTDIFDRHLYEKGSVVLYMLHRLLGEELFWKSIHVYVEKNKGQVVETGDLMQAVEEATGRNIKPFFDQWVYGAGHPTFRIRYWWNARTKEISIRIVQTQSQGKDGGLFNVESEFKFITKRGKKTVRVRIDKKGQLFHFKLDAEPRLILFDPEHALLKKVEFPKPEAMWENQLFNDSHPLGRVEAAHALARLGSQKAVEALRKALLKDSFWGVQVEVTKALGSVRTEQAALFLLNSLDVIENHKVRRAIYGALISFKSYRVVMDVAKRFPKEESYFSEMNGLRVLGHLNHPEARDILKDALKRESWNDVIRSAAIEGLAALKDRDLLPLLLSMTRLGHHHRSRIVAVRALASYGPGYEEIQNRLIELTKDPFLLVQIGAVRALQQVGDERAIAPLKKLTSGDFDGRLIRLSEEAIAAISKGFD